MTGLVMIIAMLIATVLQVYLPGHPMLGSARCPLLLAVVLYYALCRPREAMAVAACLCGVLLDTTSGIPLGFSCVCFLAIGVFASRCRSLVLVEAAITQAFFGATAAFLLHVIQFVFLRSTDMIAVSLGAGLLKATGAAVLGGLVTPLVFVLMRVVDASVGVVLRRNDVDERFGGDFGQSA
ncbi:MAG: rod shape-determining protein MreD [Kiritimatiellae bacterium]|nr:rod shape-determining protein MreD [Kiritimatiellia bacterium]